MSNWIEIKKTYIQLHHIRWFSTYFVEGGGARPTRYFLQLSFGNLEDDDEILYSYEDINERDRVLEQLKNAISQGEKNE